MTDLEFISGVRAGFPPPAPARPAKVLPHEVRLALQAAASIKDPFERAKAIDRATARARMLHPECFR